VTAKLKQAKRNDSAREVETKTNQVKDMGRKVDDAEEPVQLATALRDGAETDIVETAQTFRMKLGSRTLSAQKEPPYTSIFPKGFAYYKSAPLDEKENRYNELIARVKTHLPEGDELKAPLLSTLTQDVTTFVTASTNLEEARRTYSISRTALDTAVNEWDTLMEKTYGALISAVGKKAAERFFPKSRRVNPGDEEIPPAPCA
jgi:hypothetical protein